MDRSYDRLPVRRINGIEILFKYLGIAGIVYIIKEYYVSSLYSENFFEDVTLINREKFFDAYSVAIVKDSFTINIMCFFITLILWIIFW